MEDHSMHDGHRMEHDHFAHGDHDADPSAQHHPTNDGSAMGHMQHMMHSMTVSSFEI